MITRTRRPIIYPSGKIIAHDNHYAPRKYMRQCPNCSKNTIDTKWLLFNKFNHNTKYCFECSNCNTKIRKQKNIILDFVTADIFIIGFLVLILTISIEEYLTSFVYALSVSILFFTTLHFAAEYFATLKVAEENYCLNGLSKKGALFALILMVIIISITIYCLVIQPLILKVASCS